MSDISKSILCICKIYGVDNEVDEIRRLILRLMQYKFNDANYDLIRDVLFCALLELCNDIGCNEPVLKLESTYAENLELSIVDRLIIVLVYFAEKSNIHIEYNPMRLSCSVN